MLGGNCIIRDTFQVCPCDDFPPKECKTKGLCHLHPEAFKKQVDLRYQTQRMVESKSGKSLSSMNNPMKENCPTNQEYPYWTLTDMRKKNLMVFVNWSS